MRDTVILFGKFNRLTYPFVMKKVIFVDDYFSFLIFYKNVLC